MCILCTGPRFWMAAHLPLLLSSSCCFWECAHDSWNIQWPHCWLSCAPYWPPPSPKSEGDDDDGDGAEDGCGGDRVRDAAFINRRCCHIQRHPETSCRLCRQCMCTHQWPDVPIALGLQHLICTAKQLPHCCTADLSVRKRGGKDEWKWRHKRNKEGRCQERQPEIYNVLHALRKPERSSETETVQRSRRIKNGCLFIHNFLFIQITSQPSGQPWSPCYVSGRGREWG